LKEKGKLAATTTCAVRASLANIVVAFDLQTRPDWLYCVQVQTWTPELVAGQIAIMPQTTLPSSIRISRDESAFWICSATRSMPTATFLVFERPIQATQNHKPKKTTIIIITSIDRYRRMAARLEGQAD